MDADDRHRFVAVTEGMVHPGEVGRLHGRAELLARLPVPVQQFIVDRASGEDDRIGFVVEPYAFFLSYELPAPDEVARLLPPHYELVPSAIFAGTEPRPCGIVGAFNVHTSVFWGSRVELYVIARDTRTDLLTWLIWDYESNTISYDPGQGFSVPSTERCVVTTTHRGEVLLDVVSSERDNRIRVVADLVAGAWAPLDQRLWVEGNLSVDYGGRLAEPGSEPFGLVFDVGEMEKAQQLPLDAVAVDVNTFGADLLSDAPFEAACFPYAQHFLTSSFPTANGVRDVDALVAAVDAVVAASPG